MGILEDILARLERIEAALGTGAQPAPTTPIPQPGPQVRESEAIMSQAFPTTPAPVTQAPVATGPQAVPDLQQLTEKLLTLNEAQGEIPCLNLLRAHGGQDAEGSVSLKLVPETEYLALGQAIDQRLAGGVH